MVSLKIIERQWYGFVTTVVVGRDFTASDNCTMGSRTHKMTALTAKEKHCNVYLYTQNLAFYYSNITAQYSFLTHTGLVFVFFFLE